MTAKLTFCTFQDHLQIGVVMLIYSLKKPTGGELRERGECLNFNLDFSFYSPIFQKLVFTLYSLLLQSVLCVYVRVRETKTGREEKKETFASWHLSGLEFFITFFFLVGRVTRILFCFSYTLSFN